MVSQLSPQIVLSHSLWRGRFVEIQVGGGIVKRRESPFFRSQKILKLPDNSGRNCVISKKPS